MELKRMLFCKITNFILLRHLFSFLTFFCKHTNTLSFILALLLLSFSSSFSLSLLLPLSIPLSPNPNARFVQKKWRDNPALVFRVKKIGKSLPNNSSATQGMFSSPTFCVWLDDVSLLRLDGTSSDPKKCVI